jgi:hypothetical protein
MERLVLIQARTHFTMGGINCGTYLSLFECNNTVQVIAMEISVSSLKDDLNSTVGLAVEVLEGSVNTMRDDLNSRVGVAVKDLEGKVNSMKNDLNSYPHVSSCIIMYHHVSSCIPMFPHIVMYPHASPCVLLRSGWR